MHGVRECRRRRGVRVGHPRQRFGTRHARWEEGLRVDSVSMHPTAIFVAGTTRLRYMRDEPCALRERIVGYRHRERHRPRLSVCGHVTKHSWHELARGCGCTLAVDVECRINVSAHAAWCGVREVAALPSGICSLSDETRSGEGGE